MLHSPTIVIPFVSGLDHSSQSLLDQPRVKLALNFFFGGVQLFEWIFDFIEPVEANNNVWLFLAISLSVDFQKRSEITEELSKFSVVFGIECF